MQETNAVIASVRSRGRKAGRRALLVLASVSFAVAAASDARRVFEVDPKTAHCITCRDGDPVDEVLATARLCRERSLESWLAEHLIKSPKDHSRVNSPRGARRYFDSLVSSALCFEEGTDAVCYEHVPCRFWDCYKSYLSRYSSAGRRLWRKRVPTLDLPVVPFVAKDQIRYLSNGRDAVSLVVVQYGTGSVTAEIDLPKSLGLVVADMKPNCPAVSSGSFVAVQGWMRGREGEAASNVFVVATH
ncbi:MAG: hypothetical protein ABFD84_03240 [Candidatus Polarisedimenticolia bacterium]|nr:hypothetical protein [bacterium]